MDIGDRKKLIGMMPAGEDAIPLYELDFSNPEELIALKPATSQLSDRDWVLDATISGLFHAWGHDFMEYQMRMARLPNFPPGLKGNDYLVFWFGEAGKQVCVSGFSNDWSKLVEFMTTREWTLDQLGEFGGWMRLAKIDPRHTIKILKEYLED